MKIEIKQQHYPLIDIELIEKDIVQIWQNGDVVQVEIENLKQLALILCPELSQPELKAVKTAEDLEKIIDSELERLGYDVTGDKTSDFVDGFVRGFNYTSQFSQPKEEQPEKIVSEGTDELLEVIDCTEARRSGVDMRTILEISEENTRLKSEVEKAKEYIRRIVDNDVPSYIELIRFLEGTKTK